jgi:DNA-binding beta-propeller fold protein YncE
MRRLVAISTMLLAACAASRVADAQDKVTIETVLSGLDNPCGIAIHPTTGQVYVSVSGASKIVRFDPATKKTEDVIVGFGTDVYGKGPMYNIGPLGLVFLDDKTLIVGGGDMKDGDEIVRVFDVPEAGKTVNANDAKQKLGPLPKTDQLQAEGNFYDVAIVKSESKTADGKTESHTYLFVSSNGDDTKGWVLRAEHKDGKFDELKRSIPTKELTGGTNAPVGLAISPKGRLVVGQMGPVATPEKNSLLTFYSPKDGTLLMNLKADLYDIADLAYAPAGKALDHTFAEPTDVRLLYAVDFAWAKTDEGGLFRLDDDGKKQDDKTKAVKTTKVCSLDKPTAMAFDKDGGLYVTVFGTAKEGDKEKPGKLVKIVPKK